MSVKQKDSAKQFVEYWTGRGYEKGESQSFWLALLQDVLGVEHPERFISFEDQVHLDHTSFIDGYIEKTHVMIEQKSIDKSLSKPIKQSDGSFLTPFQQAKRYAAELPYSLRPRWIITCNFKEFFIYDMEQPNAEAQIIKLEDLPKEYYRLSFITDEGDEHLEKEKELSLEAGEIVGKLYDALLEQYKVVREPTEEDYRSLNALCVRLVFCFYAEDAGMFGRKGLFYNFMSQFDAASMRAALIELFKVLDTEDQKRDPFMRKDLLAFPYVNGGLFADEDITIPQITEEIRDLILESGSKNFDWSGISPTIFGAVFESTLNPETRRSGGMHYTSIENIHKVIDPLFLDELKDEFEQVKNAGSDIKVKNASKAFQDKLSKLKFLDPAAGSGNFLTETYLCLRRLENEALKLVLGDQIGMRFEDMIDPIKVSIDQFYGIEINDYAVSVAKTAMWIAEAQTMQETTEILHQDLDFLPLKSNVNIHEGNALRMDWNDVVPAQSLSYIMGNPPFVGARMMNKEQKQDVNDIFSGWRNVGNFDYVSCWYKKAADLIKGTGIKTALVSTNSVTQGEAVANLWKPLIADGVHINFAHRTFRWDSEASLKAHVHCVIIGFSTASDNIKYIYDGKTMTKASNINGYLLDAPDIYAKSRSKPLCAVPEIGIGNKPIDDGNYLFEKDEMNSFIRTEPKAEPYFHPWYGSREFINRRPRYCLYLGDCSPQELRQMPKCMKRIQAVRSFRLASKSAGTRKIAETPTRFHVTNMPQGNYIVIPEVSSERRRYIPMGFMTPDIMCSNLVKLIPNATLYHFGILTSNVHMAWVRTVAGRLKSDYRYSKDIVYNNFPWPDPTPEQKARIEKTAQGILDARNLYPDSSLADLYDELTMPSELRKAHQENDKAVMAAYGIKKGDPEYSSESACVAMLMKMYQKLTEEEK